MSENRCERCNRQLSDPTAEYGWRCAKILGVTEKLNSGGDRTFFAYTQGIKKANDYLCDNKINLDKVNLHQFYGAMAKREIALVMDNELLWRLAGWERDRALYDSLDEKGRKKDLPERSPALSRFIDLNEEKEKSQKFNNITGTRIENMFKEKYGKFSISKTSQKVFKQIEAVLVKNYKMRYNIDSFSPSVTIDEYFERLIGSQISAPKRKTNRIEESANRNVYSKLDEFIDEKKYQRIWPTDEIVLSKSTLEYQYFKKYEDVVNSISSSDFLIKSADMILSGIISHYSGAAKAEVIMTSLFSSIPSAEPSTLNFIEEKIGIKEIKAKKIALAYDMWQNIRNSDYRFVVNSTAKEKFIDTLEEYQEQIMKGESESEVKFKFQWEQEKYDAYRLYTIEKIKDMNMKDIDTLNDEMNNFSKYLEEKYNKNIS